jgi:LacI family transcriptional regulator
MGSLYPGITSLSRVDADHQSGGESVAKYALRVGHRRMAVLMNEHWVPGDSRLMSGIAQSLETSSERLDRFEICSLPAYERSIRHRLMELLAGNERPGIIVARMAIQVPVVFEVAKELGLRIPEDLDVVFANLKQQLPAGISIPSFEVAADMNEIGKQIGTMLAALRIGKLPANSDVEYPIRFDESS